MSGARLCFWACSLSGAKSDLLYDVAQSTWVIQCLLKRCKFACASGTYYQIFVLVWCKNLNQTGMIMEI